MWKDATSYSQGQRGKIAQTAWEITINGARIWVSRGHRYYPDDWVMTCARLGIGAVSLGKSEGVSSEQARNRAITDAWSKARQIEGEMGGLADALFAIPDLTTPA